MNNKKIKKTIILTGIILIIIGLKACTIPIAIAWKNKGDFNQKQETATKIDSTEFKTNINPKKK